MRLQAWLWAGCLLFVTTAPLAGQSASGRPLAVRLYEEGLAKQLAEDYTAAVDLYRAALRANPGYLLPMVGLAESFYELGEADEALRWALEARKADRRNRELAVLEARIRTVLGQRSEARALLAAVLADAPNDVQALLALARLESAEGNRREAVVQLERAAAVAEDDPEVILELALAYQAAGQPEKADPYLRRAVDRYSDDPRMHLAAARALVERGELAAGARALQKALVLRPDFAEAHLLLARVELASGRPSEAASAAQRALAAEDMQTRRLARYLLARALVARNDIPGALASYLEALRLAPEDEVGRVAAENLALRFPKESQAARQDLAAHHLRQGRLVLERNLLPLALIEFRRALRLAPELQEARTAYARVFRLRGFPLRSLVELLLVRDFYGSKDPEVLDDVEALCAALGDSPASRWRASLPALKGCERLADQYALARSSAAVAVFTVSGASREWHFGSAGELAEYLADLLQRHDQVRVVEGDPSVASTEEAHAAARRAGSDYYLLLEFEEGERSLRASAELHVTRTGRPLARVNQLRTGNDRVREALARLAEQVAELVPVRGSIVARELDRALIDLGRWHGVAKDDRFLIVRRGALSTAGDKPAWAYVEQDVLGEAQVIAVDEKTSEVTVRPRSFFDLVNPGDYVIPAAK